MSSKTNSPTKRMVLSAMLIAIATVLSLIKIVDLPYGGSVTLGSMLPIIIIAYRYGTAWGLLCGFVQPGLRLTKSAIHGHGLLLSLMLHLPVMKPL